MSGIRTTATLLRHATSIVIHRRNIKTEADSPGWVTPSSFHTLVFAAERDTYRFLLAPKKHQHHTQTKHLLRLLLSLVLGLLGLLLGLLRFLLPQLLHLLQLLLARLLVLLGGRLGLVHVLAGRGLSVLDVLAALGLALLVLGAEEVGDVLEEVGGDLQLGADEGHEEGGEAGAALLVVGGLLVLVCTYLLAGVMISELMDAYHSTY